MSHLILNSPAMAALVPAMTTTATLAAAALMLDPRAVVEMFLDSSRKALDFVFFLISTAFLVALAFLISESRRGEQLSVNSATVLLIISLGYLLTKFSRTLLKRAKNRRGKQSAMLLLGIAFTCVSVASAIIPSDVYIDSLVVLHPALSLQWGLVAAGWAIFLTLFARTFLIPRSTSQPVFEKDSAKARANKARRDKMREKTYPQPYPNGWYKICLSDDLECGDVMFVECLGKQLAVYRGHSGKAAILDAYCPHLGANLAVGGKVVGDCIECPFHMWQFSGSGDIVKIPYQEKIPEFAKATAYEVVEFHGHLMMWFDVLGRPAAYDLDPVEYIDNGNYAFYGNFDAGEINMHLQEFAENSVDYRHFPALHGQMMLPWTSIPIPGIKIDHQAGWVEDGDAKHVSFFKDRAELIVFGKQRPETGADVETKFEGPCSIVFFHFFLPIGKILLMQTHLPLSPVRQRVNFRWFAETHLNSLLVSYVVGNWISQWRQDLMIWENKVYLNKPLVVKNDGPVSKLRRWYMQFYEGYEELEEEDRNKPSNPTEW